MNTIAPHTTNATDRTALDSLRNHISGEVLVSGEPEYDQARQLVNKRFDYQPALIARCQSAQDVAHAISFAREHNLEIAVRSGGHSAVGHSACDNGMMIDLSQMRDIAVDSMSRTARVQPGVTNGELVQALGTYGLATTTGTYASVGMGGSTLGGGLGWLMGRFGATIDNVLAFEVVTADGTIVTARTDENPDLFWALRGGGGNFGVVTAITYQLHPLTQVLGGVALFPLDNAAPILHMYRDLSSSAPDELTIHAVLATVPQFGPALVLQVCYSGIDLDEGERMLKPVRSSEPAIDTIARRSYAELYAMLTPPSLPGVAYHDTFYALRQPSDAALDEIVALAKERPSPLSVITIHQVHGAATRVAPDATALALREPHYAIANIAMWLEGTGAAEMVWVQHVRQRMAPFASRGLYVNFLSNEGDAGVREAYCANYDRLAAIKSRYDPENVFHRNQNIRPAERR